MEIVEGIFISEYGTLSNVSQDPVNADFFLLWVTEKRMLW